MSERAEIEQQIREVLATEGRAIPLSGKLFSPSGLFSKLASSEEERRLLVQTELFKEAQRRLSLLQKQEAAEFARAVQQAQAALPDSGYRLKMEWTE
jgi:hypothetical protein